MLPVFVFILLCVLSLCNGQLQCPTGFIFYKELFSCLPKCISLDDTRNMASYECLYVGNYSIPLAKHCDYSYQCRSGYCECRNGVNASNCMMGEHGFIANNSGICKSRNPCSGSPHIPNPSVTVDKTVVFDYKTNKLKRECNNVYSNDICIFQCIPGYIAIDGYFQIKCTLNLTFDKDVIKCEKCPKGFTNNHHFTKCVQKCTSNDDERGINGTLCLYNNGQIPNGYHCTQYFDCKSGVCKNNKCFLSLNKEIVFEKDIKYGGKFINVYSNILNISQCLQLCISFKYSRGLCTHFSYNRNNFNCFIGESRVYSKRIEMIEWISGFIRTKATFEIVLRQNVSSNIYFNTDEILECNINNDASRVFKFSQLKYFVNDERYKSVTSMFEFILNINEKQYHWMQNWNIIQNMDQLQSIQSSLRFSWIAINDPTFVTLRDFKGLYQTVNESKSLLNALPFHINAHPIGWIKPLSNINYSVVWMAARIQVIEDEDSWELVLDHNVAEKQYYFDKESVERINYDYKEKESQHSLYSILSNLDIKHKAYLDENNQYHFKLLYPHSIFQYDAIYWKQSTNPIKSTIIKDFELMQFLSSKYTYSAFSFAMDFHGLKLINDNMSYLGTDNINTTFRIGQFMEYAVTYEIPSINNNTISIAPMGGIIGPIPQITHDEPRKSLESVSLYARNHRKCRDWMNECWKYMIDGECARNAQVAVACRKSCKLCNFVSRTDLYEFHLGSSTLPRVSVFIQYTKPFHRIPLIGNVWLNYVNDEEIESDSNILIQYDDDTNTNKEKKKQVSFTFSNTNNNELEGWKDDIIVYWNVYEDWSPLCNYHNDAYCLSINRKGCSPSFYDNSCMQCMDGFTELSEATIYGAMECVASMPDVIVVITDNDDDTNMIHENELKTLSINRQSYYGTSSSGIGSIEILYTIEHWQTDDDDFDSMTVMMSGALIWKNGDKSTKTIDILAIDDHLFELTELFWLRLMINSVENNISLQSDKIEMGIKGPNNLYEYRGWIDILDENLTLITNTTISCVESDRTLIFYLKLTNSTNYCEVYYETKENTAIAGHDFMSINQSLIYDGYDDDNIKQIKVRIYDDDIWEIKHKVFSLSLWKTFGVSAPVDTLTFIIIDNDPIASNCNLTEWSEWSECDVIRGNQQIYRWKMDAIADEMYHLKCENITQSKYCTNWDKSLKPGIAITPVQFQLNIDQKKELSIMLQTPPNLTIDLGYNPYEIGQNRIVAQITLKQQNLIFYPQTVRFTVNSWYYPQSIFVTAMNNTDRDIDDHDVLSPEIIIKSADPNYFELTQDRKSILGAFIITIIHDQSQTTSHHIDNASQSHKSKHNLIIIITIIVVCVILFCLIIVSIFQWKKKRKNKKNKKKKKSKRENKMELYKEFEDDAILQDLIDE